MIILFSCGFRRNALHDQQVEHDIILSLWLFSFLLFLSFKRKSFETKSGPFPNGLISLLPHMRQFNCEPLAALSTKVVSFLFQSLSEYSIPGTLHFHIRTRFICWGADKAVLTNNLATHLIFKDYSRRIGHWTESGH